MTNFGELLRTLRVESGKSMGDLARYLGISVPYLSDVERGNRAPLTSERTIAAARFLEVDCFPLLVAAAECRGAFELSVDKGRPKATEVGAALMRGWAELSDEDLELIHNIMNKKDRK